MFERLFSVYCTVQIREFWSKVFSLSQKSKIKVLKESSVCFRQALIAFWNKKRTKIICILLVEGKKEKDDQQSMEIKKNNCSYVSEKVFFSNRNSLSTVSVYLLAASFSTFTFNGRTFTDRFSSWTFHISAFSLEINPEYLTVQLVAVWAIRGKGTVTELIFLVRI